MKQIVLASQSPRRRDLLKMMEYDFEVIPSDCEEDETASSPSELVCILSSLKCHDVANRIISGSINLKMKCEDGCIVIGSDTIVVFDGKIIGKPKDENEAFETLKMLRGNTHKVYTGVTLVDTVSGKEETFYEETEVTMFPVTDEDIRNYIATGDPLDKAGSYGVQGRGAFLVKEVRGDYFTVVGLPLGRLYHELKKFRVDC